MSVTMPEVIWPAAELEPGGGDEEPYCYCCLVGTCGDGSPGGHYVPAVTALQGTMLCERCARSTHLTSGKPSAAVRRLPLILQGEVHVTAENAARSHHWPWRESPSGRDRGAEGAAAPRPAPGAGPGRGDRSTTGPAGRQDPGSGGLADEQGGPPAPRSRPQGTPDGRPAARTARVHLSRLQ